MNAMSLVFLPYSFIRFPGLNYKLCPYISSVNGLFIPSYNYTVRFDKNEYRILATNSDYSIVQLLSMFTSIVQVSCSVHYTIVHYNCSMIRSKETPYIRRTSSNAHE